LTNEISWPGDIFPDATDFPPKLTTVNTALDVATKTNPINSPDRMDSWRLNCTLTSSIAPKHLISSASRFDILTMEMFVKRSSTKAAAWEDIYR
jgi:hypothetical protein